jgi:hypothetical protein
MAMGLPVADATTSTAASAASPASAAAQRVDGHNASESTNWSGYYETTGAPYTEVKSTWQVPSVSKSTGSSYSSSWIGIDGATNTHLIQTGTESDYYGGKAHYDAWWEILPAPETVIAGLAVSPGNTMSASIVKHSGTEWTIDLANLTTNRSFTINKTYKGPAASVEWIEEAPTVNGSIATLAHYSKITFLGDLANNASPNLKARDESFMVNSNGKIISSPSAPGGNPVGTGFSVAYGSKSPPPPS